MLRLVRLFAIALFMSFVTSVFYYKIISPEPTDYPSPVAALPYSSEEYNRVLVVVAEVNIDPFSRLITESMVKRVKYPEKLLPRYAPLDVKDVLGKYATEPIYRGEIVSLQRLMSPKGSHPTGPPGVYVGDTSRTLVIKGGKGYLNTVSSGCKVDLIAKYGYLPHDKKEPIELCRTVVFSARIIEAGKIARKRLNGVKLKEDEEAFSFYLTKRSGTIIDHVSRQGVCSFYMALRHPTISAEPDTEGFGSDQLSSPNTKRSFAPGTKPSKELIRKCTDTQTVVSPPKKKYDFNKADFGDFSDDDDDADFDAFDGF